MTRESVIFIGGRFFDGNRLHDGKAASFRDGIFTGLVPETETTRDCETVDLDGGILSPGYVDLQVNGGDGVMFNDDPSVATLTRIASAHRSLGTTAILPTLITDTPEKTKAAIDAARYAINGKVPGIAGLHLEGPHLSVARKGAHDADLIRPMEDTDLRLLLAAKADIPVLKVTVAPESTTPDQIATLAAAGILVSLGHTDAGFETCKSYAEAGARCVTHLFNAMSQLGNREPGLVGATLATGTLSAGLIADGIHVHPAAMRTAWDSKAGPGQIFLVSDAMAVAGTALTEFFLEGRRISRNDGRLTLEDGTLAGADLDLTTAIRVLVNDVGVALEQALQATTTTPGALIDQPTTPRPGSTHLSDLIHISSCLRHLTPLDRFASSVPSKSARAE
ncbi:N-acetylglucosamine-6-phosphate deacetylase [Ruegeria sp. 2012CJ41-6]|uniref:N-acetylglucosamine-6-phosphate deacetylase n=1 Tax=Ruegeria spongiae TaxID=2942209 RepID=A0ABT0Q6X8_9RHOB|nr:N-acetylglucosamine-6-phosphate deacetylase [Ruegeria spongiae]MCL6284908.1 N-acetylglucosamine-6-phosphate deacetylase [Ruegeria spongiae]